MGNSDFGVSLEGIENSLESGQKKLLGGFAAAGSAGLFSLMSYIWMLGGEKQTIDILGVPVPPYIAVAVSAMISGVFGFAALIALRKARTTLVRFSINSYGDEEIDLIQSVLSNFPGGTLLAIGLSMPRGIIGLNPNKDKSWMNDVQTKLSGCSFLVTNPIAVKVLCFITVLILYNSWMYSILDYLNLGGADAPLILSFIVSACTLPYLLLIINLWLVMFSPNSYDGVGGAIMKFSYGHHWGLYVMRLGLHKATSDSSD